MNYKEGTSDYLKTRQEGLADELTGKTIVYLDTKYWIILRDQFLNITPNKDLYNIVLALAETEKCIFPISEVTFMEILKQGDLTNLKVNIELIDKISKGISFVTLEQMRELEFKIFWKGLIRMDVASLKKHIWVKLPFILFPNVTKTETIDKFWNYSFEELFDNLSRDSSYKPFSFSDNTAYFDEKKKLHAHENPTFDGMFLSELGGTLDLYDDLFKKVMGELYYEQSGKFPTKEELDNPDLPKYSAVIYNAFKLKKITKELPSFRIFSGLFAANRWNKGQKHHKNDTMDVLHATFALPYCDYFFTEKNLANMITQNHTSYDKLYSCTVLYQETDIIHELTKIYET